MEVGTRRLVMKGKYLRRIGGLILSTLMLAGIVFVSPASVEAQRGRRIVIVRPYPYRFYRPYYWGYDPYWSPWSPYGNYYSHYVFDSGQEAMNQAYKDGFKPEGTTERRIRVSIQNALTTSRKLGLATSLKFTDQVS
jgi:hypothetical protein